VSNTDCCSLADAKLTHSSKLLSAQAHGVLRDLPGRSYSITTCSCTVSLIALSSTMSSLPLSRRGFTHAHQPSTQSWLAHLTQNFTRTSASQRVPTAYGSQACRLPVEPGSKPCIEPSDWFVLRVPDDRTS
jgi:hypothetical protein